MVQRGLAALNFLNPVGRFRIEGELFKALQAVGSRPITSMSTTATSFGFLGREKMVAIGFTIIAVDPWRSTQTLLTSIGSLFGEK
jgi:hypothetical protein